jgi:peptidoglycan/xylan/chitin deacetylase (PgdA/CDA1 family)
MKKIIKKIGTSILFKSGFLKILEFNTKIIAYHKANPKYFEEQMKYLKNNYEVVSLQVALKDLNRKQVIITFDDGYKNNMDVAYPILKKLGLKATVYVTCDFIDNNTFTWWDKLDYADLNNIAQSLKTLTPEEIIIKSNKLTNIGDISKPKIYDFMSWKDVEKIKGVFEIGSHTLTHPILTNIPIKLVSKEFVESKKKIEKKLKIKINSLAYPNGNYNDKIIKIAENAGYNNAVLYKKGNNTESTNKYSLLRRGINFEDDLAIFACKVAGIF